MSVPGSVRSLSWIRRLWRAVSSDRLLGLVSGTILAWNTVPTFASTPVLGALVRDVTDLQAALPGPQIVFGLSVLLLAVLVASSLPQVYVDPLDAPLQNHRRVRGLLTVYAFSVATLHYVWGLSWKMNGLPPGVSRPPQWLLLGSVAAGFPLLLWGLLTVESRSLRDPDNYFTRPLAFASPDGSTETMRAEMETLNARPLVGRFARATIPAASTGVYLMPAALFGLLAGVLNLYYPVLEVAALLGVVGRWLLRRERTPAVESQLGGALESATAVDTGFYRQLRTAVSVRAWGVFVPLLFATLFTVMPVLTDHVFRTPVGAFVPGVLLDAYAAVFELGTIGAVGYAVERTGDALVWAALSVTPPLVVCYGLWYWYHAVRRVPSLLYESGLTNRENRLPGSARRPPVSRPVGYFLPLGLPVVAWLEYRYTWGESFLSLPLASGEFGFLLVWSLGVLLLVWTVLRTWTATPRPPSGSLWELYAPLVVQLVVVIDLSLNRLVEFESIVTLLGLSLFMFHGRTLIERVYGYSRSRRILACLVAGAALYLVLSLYVPSLWSVVAGLGLFALLVGGGEMHEVIESA